MTKKKTGKKASASKREIKRAAETEPTKEEVQKEAAELMNDERNAGVNYAEMDEKDRHAAMTHRQKMAIQNAKAKRKFTATHAGLITIPDSMKDKVAEDADAIVTVDLPVEVKINQRRYGPGQVKVPKHLAETMIPMVYKKQQADISVFTGKNYRVQRIGGRMVKTELSGSAGLDIQKLVNS